MRRNYYRDMKTTQSITEYDLAKQFSPCAIVEIHYQRTDTLHTYNTGILTAAHSASSYGIPVFIAGSNFRTNDPLVPGQVYGIGELPTGYDMQWLVGHHITCNEDNDWSISEERSIAQSAKNGGYNLKANVQDLG